MHIPVKIIFCLQQFAQLLLWHFNLWRHGRQNSRRSGWIRTILLLLQSHSYVVRMVFWPFWSGVPKVVQKTVMQTHCKGEVRAQREGEAGKTHTKTGCRRKFVPESSHSGSYRAPYLLSCRASRYPSNVDRANVIDRILL